MKSLSPQLNQRVEEGSVIGKPEHNWQRNDENIWKCSECPALDPQHQYGEDPPQAPYFNEHDRTCPCFCIVCSGEYQRITNRHLLKQAPPPRPGRTSYLETLLAITNEAEAWILKRKQEEGRQ
jgi:hypothetical protein